MILRVPCETIRQPDSGPQALSDTLEKSMQAHRLDA
jgi:hypothetical protein